MIQVACLSGLLRDRDRLSASGPPPSQLAGFKGSASCTAGPGPDDSGDAGDSPMTRMNHMARLTQITLMTRMTRMNLMTRMTRMTRMVIISVGQIYSRTFWAEQFPPIHNAPHQDS